MGMTRLRVAVDVGGTFTDIQVLDEATGEVQVGKVPSTPEAPMNGVINAIESMDVDLKAAVFFSHGTTVATNALITRRLPRTAMVASEGFRDVVEIRRGTKEDLWDAYKDVAPPYIPRRDRLTIRERVDFSGEILTPVDEAEAADIARILRKRGVEAVAICFMNSFSNPANEARMKELLEAELPGVSVSASSEVLPEMFEHERFSTAMVNAVLTPLVSDYVSALDDELRQREYGGDLVILHSGGGVMTPSLSRRYAARLAGSGIAAGAIASRHIARLCGCDNAIGLDMGGTSTDISLAYEGELRVTKDWHIEYGYPIAFPSIEVLTIGAGGGSLAWIDEAGSLRSGPQSAGALPGPACYRAGGTEPTNSDANLQLGRLGESLIGGAMTLDREAATTAIDSGVGQTLGLSPDEAASAILRVANANMANAVRLTSIGRGYDPREFALVVFGGAGPLHGAALAKELAIPTVIVPPNPGITSALGCLLVDIRHDLSSMYLSMAADAELGEVEARFQELEAEAHDRLAAEGVPPERMALQRSIDMRYQGQWRSLAIPVDAPVKPLDEVMGLFHDQHARVHNFRRDDAPIEMYRLNLTAIGVTPKPDLARHSANGASAAPTATRPVAFDETDGFIDTPVYDRASLSAGTTITGPAVIEQFDSTTLVPPGIAAEVDEWLNIRMQIPLEAR